MACKPFNPPGEDNCFRQFEEMFGLRSARLSRHLPSWQWVLVTGIGACSFFFVFPTISQVITDLRWARFPLMFCVLMTLTPWLIPKPVFRMVKVPMGEPLTIDRLMFPGFAPFMVRFSRAALFRSQFLYLPFVIPVLVATHVVLVNGGLRFWWDIPIGFVSIAFGVAGGSLLQEPVAVVFCPSSVRLYYGYGYQHFPLDQKLFVYEGFSGLSSRVAFVHDGRFFLFNAVIEDVFPHEKSVKSKCSVIRTLHRHLKPPNSLPKEESQKETSNGSGPIVFGTPLESR